MTSPPPSPAMPKYKLAEYRYGREEMLALYVKDNKVGGETLLIVFDLKAEHNDDCKDEEVTKNHCISMYITSLHLLSQFQKTRTCISRSNNVMVTVLSYAVCFLKHPELLFSGPRGHAG